MKNANDELVVPAELLPSNLSPEEQLVSTMITGKPSANAFAVATATVLIITLMTLFYWRDPFIWSHYFAAINEKFFHNQQSFRIFTAIFVHSDLSHLLSNLLMLWIFSFLYTDTLALAYIP